MFPNLNQSTGCEFYSFHKTNISLHQIRYQNKKGSRRNEIRRVCGSRRVCENTIKWVVSNIVERTGTVTLSCFPLPTTITLSYFLSHSSRLSVSSFGNVTYDILYGGVHPIICYCSSSNDKDHPFNHNPFLIHL